METLDLRGHHLNGLKLIFTLPKQDFIELLKKEGYTSPKDSLLTKDIYSYLKTFFHDQNNQVRLNTGRLDLICKNCPKRRNCDINKPLTGFKAFSQASSSGELADSQTLERYGLQKDRAYSVKEIRQKVGF